MFCLVTYLLVGFPKWWYPLVSSNMDSWKLPYEWRCSFIGKSLINGPFSMAKLLDISRWGSKPTDNVWGPKVVAKSYRKFNGHFRNRLIGGIYYILCIYIYYYYHICIYKAYVSGLCKGISPHPNKYGLKNGTVPPF